MGFKVGFNVIFVIFVKKNFLIIFKILVILLGKRAKFWHQWPQWQRGFCIGESIGGLSI
jgi:hypothetical protein